MKRMFLIGVLGFMMLAAQAQLKVASVFGDHMVLQREQPIRIWGMAKAGQSISAELNGVKSKTVTDKSGLWRITLKPQNAGGPFVLKVTAGKEAISFEDILIGDVWIASGQSNMEWPLLLTKSGEATIEQSSNAQIRLFTVEKGMASEPASEVKSDGWKVSSPATTPNFSAVAYHFGSKINHDLEVPVGLIHSSWGGTDIETWMSWEALASTSLFNNLSKETFVAKSKAAKASIQKFQDALANDQGLKESWFLPQTDFNSWDSVHINTTWENTKIGNEDGIIWFAKSFVLTNEQVTDATLSLGAIDDIDDTYINGQFVGRSFDWTAGRQYEVKAQYLKPGLNWLVVKVTDGQGGGGIYGAADQQFLQTANGKVRFSGLWKFKPSVLSSKFGSIRTGPNEFPTELYNAMIAPVTGLAIKGAIWYQGENNTSNPKAYEELFPAMITDWRKQFGQEFPFLWVQLANFMAESPQPSESNWAALRDVQTKTLSLPKTGQAVIIDIGEAFDIHPRNKKDVGLRLALAAEKVAYGKELIYSGPVYQSSKVEGNQIIVSFDHIGSELDVHDKYGYVKGFAIAGADKKFVWAQGKVINNQVVLWSDQVSEPKYIRYAWGDNPADVNLYNKEGLPARPFKTD